MNAKRVLRILQKHGLTLQRHTGRQLGRTHDEVVVALISHVRPRRSPDRRPCRNRIIRLLPDDGAPTTLNSPAAMARSSASCSRLTPVTGKSLPRGRLLTAVPVGLDRSPPAIDGRPPRLFGPRV